MAKQTVHAFALNEITPAHPENFKVISWQRLGLAIPGGNPVYKAVRTNRLSGLENVVAKPFQFYAIVSLRPTDKYAGKEITIHVSIKGSPNATSVNSMMLSSASDTVFKPAGYLNADGAGHKIDSIKRVWRY
jgi:hypothetical protein